MIIADGPLPPTTHVLMERESPALVCATVGLVEDGALDGKTIMDLRDLAGIGDGAWDLANGHEIGEAVYSMGAHLYQRFSPIRCSVVVFDYGTLGLYQQTVLSAITKLSNSLAAAMATTEITVRWQAMIRRRAQASGPSIHPMRPQDQCIAWIPGRIDSVPGRDCQEPREMADHDGHKAYLSMEKIIQWGLWLSGGALFSTLMLLAKK